MSSLCQVRADTNLGIEKFYFSIFVPLFEIVLLSGYCRGGALFNPILTGYKSTPRLSIGKRARAYCLPVVRARAALTRCTKAMQRAVSVLPCQSSERVPRRPAALKQCSVLCPCCLPVVRARAAPTRCTKAVQRAVSVLPCQSVRACAALTLCCLSGHHVHALSPVRASHPCSVAHPVRAHMGQNVALWENMPQKREFGQ